MRKLILSALLLLSVSIVLATQFFDPSEDNTSNIDGGIERDLAAIKERGKLVALTPYNSTGYFLYKGRPMGFEYELLVKLAEQLDVKLEIVTVKNFDSIFDMLNRGEGDIIAAGVTVTKDRKRKYTFTDHYGYTRQVLVQRRPTNWRKMKLHRIEDMLVRNLTELAGQTVHVKRESSFFERLKNVSEEIGSEINIVHPPENATVESLIEQVDGGEIDFTVADEHIARLNKSHLYNIDVKTPISFKQRLAWVVRENSPELLAAVNGWINDVRGSEWYNVVYNKYFKNRTAFKNRMRSDFFTYKTGRISPYDKLIKANIDSTFGWDWRLIAALMYQESQFNPRKKSFAGAIGLMQLMPETAKRFGCRNMYNPTQNIKAGIKLLDWLDEQWEPKVADSTERIKFVLASYNVGFGHVLDARRLAVKYGKDNEDWEEVAFFLKNKSKPKYYSDPVAKFGYCRGIEPVNFVEEITERFNHYKRVTDSKTQAEAGLTDETTETVDLQQP